MSTPPTHDALQLRITELEAREAQLQSTLSAARAREAATAQILGTISSTPSALDTILATIGDAAKRLCDADLATIMLVDTDGDLHGWHTLSGYETRRRGNFDPALIPDDDFMKFSGRVEDFPSQYPGGARTVREDGLTELAQIHVPLRSTHLQRGLFIVRRNTARAFNDEHVELLQSFATQAVVAINNSRLVRQLRDSDQQTREALEVQRVMANVLGIVAAAPSNLEVALQEIGRAAESLTRSSFVLVAIMTGGNMTAWNSQIGNFSTEAGLDHEGKVVRGESVSQAATRENRVIELVGPVSAWADQYPRSAELNRELGLGDGSFLAIPLPGDAGPIGSIFLARREAVHFTESEKSIIRALSDQAVIAIQNATLFGELQVRNKEINAALEQQTAIAEVLEVIASAPEDLDTVLPRLASAAATLCEADGVVVSYGTGNGRRAWVSGVGFASLEGMPSAELSERVPGGIAFLTGQPVRFAGTLDAVSETYPRVVAEMRARGHSAHAALAVPLPGNAGPVGAIVVSRHTAAPFADRHVPILETFANQAVIAIENARLIRELRERNREISENLDVRRVMGEVLAIVASAPTDLSTTLPKIAEAAAQLCDADIGAGPIWIEGNSIVSATSSGELRVDPWESDGPTHTTGQRAIREGRTVEWQGSIASLRVDYPLQAARSEGFPEISLLSVPMRGPTGVTGALTVVRSGSDPFPDRQQGILRALASQAVVAIENALLFKQLQEKTEALEIASRHKSEFLANMSHELRTPLNAIIGYSELLQEECEDLGQDNFLPDLGKIQTAGKHLLTLISGILDLSKVEAGRMTMFLEDFDISMLVRDADAIVRPLVEKNRNTFVIDCPDDIGGMHADLVKVRQVLFNLLSNSAKFTEGGTISLTVRKPVADATVTLAIRDTGIGITEDQLVRLFEAFSQANAETSRKYGGTGLGLALSREFSRMMGGDITVASEAGAGSTFTVTLPVQCIDTEIAS